MRKRKRPQQPEQEPPPPPRHPHPHRYPRHCAILCAIERALVWRQPRHTQLLVRPTSELARLARDLALAPDAHIIGSGSCAVVFALGDFLCCKLTYTASNRKSWVRLLQVQRRLPAAERDDAHLCLPLVVVVGARTARRRRAARFNADNLAQLINCGSRLLVMEVQPRYEHSLYDFCRRFRVYESWRLEAKRNLWSWVVTHVLAGLRTLHRDYRFCHLDVTSGNVFLTVNGHRRSQSADDVRARVELAFTALNAACLDDFSCSLADFEFCSPLLPGAAGEDRCMTANRVLTDHTARIPGLSSELKGSPPYSVSRPTAVDVYAACNVACQSIYRVPVHHAVPPEYPLLPSGHVHASPHHRVVAYAQQHGADGWVRAMIKAYAAVTTLAPDAVDYLVDQFDIAFIHRNTTDHHHSQHRLAPPPLPLLPRRRW